MDEGAGPISTVSYGGPGHGGALLWIARLILSCKTLPMSFQQGVNGLRIVLALLVLTLPGSAQESGRRPLTPEQGKAIVKAAWARERRGGRKPDCSHLVHEVYESAGFPYSYANSFELYAGTSSFVPVTRPQAGDLVVWRGHVGIVVDLRQRSFYSSVRSGVRTDSYDSRPWKARGKARFYRYLAAPAVNFASNSGRAAEESDKHLQAVKKMVPEAVEGGGPFTAPESILIATSEDKPTEAEIGEAISELNNAAGGVLRSENFLQSRRKITIYEDLAVERATLKAGKGSAQTRIAFQITVSGEHVERKRRHEKFRWELVRGQAGWQVLAPKDRIYVPRDVAVRMLSARLDAHPSGAARSAESVRQERQVIHILDALLEEDR